jgi:hypothetical protein
MSSKERKILDISVAPQKLSQFRESLQGAFETCDAKAYAEYIGEDVRSSILFLKTTFEIFSTLI